MDPQSGEDSGLEFEDSNLQIPEQNPYEEGYINEPGTEEPDEGIGISMISGTPPELPFERVVYGGQGIIVGRQQGVAVPPHIQIQEAHDAFLQRQMELRAMFAENLNDQLVEESNSNSNSNPPPVFDRAEESNDNGENDLVRAGDDNNNDRPDDVNNNTTDPAMEQLQRQQRELALEQQQRQEQERRRLMVASVDDDDNYNDNDKKKKDKKKKKKKKKKRSNAAINGVSNDDDKDEAKEFGKTNGETDTHADTDSGVEVEYVAERLELSVFDPLYRAFANVFENFRISDASLRNRSDTTDKPQSEEISLKKVPKIELDDDLDEKKDDDKPKLSKRKLKKLTRLSVAELKQVVQRPDVVEMHDVTAKDPKLLVHLKSYRNTVPVPRHWCYKRKYLQGKRGIEKAPFDLPGFIKKTGIMEMRAALAEKEEHKTLKAKMRERVRPKMGKIDIDYQKLHDAFFKWQSKPKMTIHGDLYYEGKEFETRMKDKKPGELSDDLRTALGMPVGPNSNRVPPPWLIAMQRYGPPPSYPHLKIMGLNAPIPESCSFGYHAGGWGKPPVDGMGRPLYGDVFGQNADGTSGNDEEYVDKNLWGVLESEDEAESEEEEEEEEEKDEEEETEIEESGIQTPAVEGMATPSGFSSVPAGLETPELIELRKRRIEQDMEGGDTPSLYTVLPEKRVDRLTGAMMASTHVYDMTAAAAAKAPARGLGTKDASMVEVALDPSELDLDISAMEARYEQSLKEKQSHIQGEDLSDMVAEHAAKQKNKRKRQLQQQDNKKGAKKQKEFKF